VKPTAGLFTFSTRFAWTVILSAEGAKNLKAALEMLRRCAPQHDRLDDFAKALKPAGRRDTRAAPSVY